MSFSNELKNEAAKIKIDSFDLILAELSAFVRSCGEIKFLANDLTMEFVTENASIARRIFTLLKNYTQTLEIFRKGINQSSKKGNYIIRIKDSCSVDDLLFDTQFVLDKNYDNKNYRIADKLMRDEQTRAYLRASFLGGGSVTDPEKAYHLELVSPNEEHALDLKEILNRRGLKANTTKRRSSHVIYMKEAEQISDFMALIGVNQSLFKFENIRIVKDLRNNVNRLVNCETANINRTINASVKQVEDIRYLMKIGKFDSLPEDLKEVAILRIENEESSLKEIAELTKGKYSRSGINYRLKKIKSLTDKLRGATDERDES